MKACLVLVSLWSIILNCSALPDGAPQSACSSMVPDHRGIQPKQSRPPYSVSAEKIGEGKVKVTISSNDGTRHALPFQGFILQARSALDRNKLVAGEFKRSEESKTIVCSGHKKSTLTHKNANPKSEVITEWTSGENTDVIFRATVATNFSYFWKNIDSEPVKLSDVKIPSTEKVPVYFIYDGCHELNNCVGMPEKCIEKSNCQVLLTYENLDGNIKFTMQGLLNESEYMAMGLSDDNEMGDDFVTECFRNGANDVVLQNSWNEGKSNTMTTEASVNYDFEIADGITKCTWTEANVTNSNGRTYDFINEKYYILLAQGPIKHGRITYHTFKMSSSKPIDFFERKVTDSAETDDITRDYPEELTNEPEEKLTTKSNVEHPKSVAPNNCSWFNLFCLTLLGLYAYTRLKSSVL